MVTRVSIDVYSNINRILRWSRYLRCLLHSTVNIDKVVIHILKHVNSSMTDCSPIGLMSEKLKNHSHKGQCHLQEKKKKTSSFTL